MDGAKKLAHLLEGCGAKYTRTIVIAGTLFTVSTGDGQYFVLVRNDDAGIEMWSRYFTPEQAIAATVDRRDTMGLWPEWEQVLFANVSDEVAQDNLNECVHDLLDKAATVGRGNLTAEQVREAIMSADRWRKPMGDTGMTNTHLIIRDDGWQAIADELNATVGVGTCELINAADDLGEGTSSCMCSKCGYTALDDWWDEFKHCPNCGAKVVSE